MAKKPCEHPEHAIRYDPRTGKTWCANCGEVLRGATKQPKAK